MLGTIPDGRALFPLGRQVLGFPELTAVYIVLWNLRGVWRPPRPMCARFSPDTPARSGTCCALTSTGICFPRCCSWTTAGSSCPAGWLMAGRLMCGPPARWAGRSRPTSRSGILHGRWWKFMENVYPGQKNREAGLGAFAGCVCRVWDMRGAAARWLPDIFHAGNHPARLSDRPTRKKAAVDPRLRGGAGRSEVPPRQQGASPAFTTSSPNRKSETPPVCGRQTGS